METCGMILAIPATAIASLGYTALAVFLFGRWRVVRLVLIVGSSAVLLLTVAEGVLLLSLGGVLGARATLGPSFHTLYDVVFYFTPPAVANLVAFVPQPSRDWKLVAAATFFVALLFVYWNISVDDTLYGPDGVGGPYSAAPPDA